ncbi:MAG: type 4a pilus biogenesis protein PilO [Candidatus Nomurabacteria bacterium]|nr:type 4a pilus biogenesis protein PilO [Candidatus Nomurabacteria bacterium]
MRFLLPIILIAISISGFFMFLNPTYTEIKSLQTKIESYNTALSNSKSLENQRDKLASKYNSIDTQNLDKLTTLLPDSVDNIRLILEIEKIATPYGMALKDVKYNPIVADPTVNSANKKLLKNTATKKDYGSWDLEFSTSGTYDDFISFSKDLEKNLRIVDISSVDFSADNNSSSGTGMLLATNSSSIYKFNFKIRTYWLKN